VIIVAKGTPIEISSLRNTHRCWGGRVSRARDSVTNGTLKTLQVDIINARCVQTKLQTGQRQVSESLCLHQQSRLDRRLRGKHR
jgi:hypothetical protein